MRDCASICQHMLSDDMIYKEVVVIGNGPSGMVTSFMLAGNVPHLKQVPDSLPIDEMLKARLQNLPPGQNLLEVDLMQLAEGLEGRSQNPIPLLIDILLRPCADMGMEEESLIEWRYHVEKQIDHLVLGKGPPGGAWHTFPGTVRSLSPASWLALPPHAGVTVAGGGRVPARAVAMYCRKYVQACKLQRFFRNGVTVTSVQQWASGGEGGGGFIVRGWGVTGRPLAVACRRLVLATGAGDLPNTLSPPASRLDTATLCARDLLTVEHAINTLARRRSVDGDGGRDSGTVLVVGSGVSAADAVRLARNASLKVLHVHRAPADSLAKLSPAMYPDYCHVYKMMIDGTSGDHLNYTPYADHALLDICPIIPQTPLKLQEDIDDETNILNLKRVKLLDLRTNQITEVSVSLVAVLIGSRPDLSFLQVTDNSECIKCIQNQNDDQKQCFLRNHWHYIKTVLEQSLQSCKSKYLNNEINGNTQSLLEDRKVTCQCQTECQTNGVGLGVDEHKPVDGRSNPVAIDKSVHEVLAVPGMYALGPLTADNFMRFIPGGAVAIVSHIHGQTT